jgi:hypothetical protein
LTFIIIRHCKFQEETSSAISSRREQRAVKKNATLLGSDDASQVAVLFEESSAYAEIAGRRAIGLDETDLQHDLL